MQFSFLSFPSLSFYTFPLISSSLIIHFLFLSLPLLSIWFILSLCTIHYHLLFLLSSRLLVSSLSTCNFYPHRFLSHLYLPSSFLFSFFPFHLQLSLPFIVSHSYPPFLPVSVTFHLLYFPLIYRLLPSFPPSIRLSPSSLSSLISSLPHLYTCVLPAHCSQVFIMYWDEGIFVFRKSFVSSIDPNVNLCRAFFLVVRP